MAGMLFMQTLVMQATIVLFFTLVSSVSTATAANGELACDENNAQDLIRQAENGVAEAQTCLGRLFLENEKIPNHAAKAVSWFQKAASQGDVQAMTELGLCYQHGRGVDRDRVKAAGLYKAAAESGDAKAQNLLGDCYDDFIGIGLPADKTQALFWYEKAAAQNYPQAQVALANYYSGNSRGPDDRKMAYELYKKAMAGGDSHAIYRLAQLSSVGAGDVAGSSPRKEAIMLFKSAALGDPDAIEDISSRFEGSGAFPKSYECALNWAEKYDNSFNDPGSCSRVELIEFMREGESFKTYIENPTLDPDRFKRLATSSDPADWNRLGLDFWNCGGGEREFKNAFEWFAKAAQRENVDALLNLAFCYATGIGTEVNDAKAYEAYRKAASLGSAEAQDLTGFCLEYGIGTPPLMKEALVYYEQAAQNGYLPARFAMAFRYLHGWEVERDEQRAIVIFKESARAGSNIAMLALADCYDRGIGVERDGARAWFWYRTANDGARTGKAHNWLERHDSEGAPRDCQDDTQVQAEANAPGGLGHLGLCYMTRPNVTEDDLCNGIELLTRAMEQGDTYATGWLAHYYATGCGVPQDLTKAFELYEELAEREGGTYADFVARCYEDGIGVERNREKAIEWYKRAAQQGDGTAALALIELRP